MATRQQIRERVRILFGQETDSNTSRYSDTQLNGLIDQAIGQIATFIEYPRDLVEVTSEQDKGAYTLPSDTVKVLTVDFGNRSSAGDCEPIKYLNLETLRGLYPDWLDNTSSSQGRPKYWTLLDRNTILVHPRPNSSEAGKKIIMSYVYLPASLASDSSTPDLPPAAHMLVPFYVLYLAYTGLTDIERATTALALFDKELDRIKPMLEKEAEEGFKFTWGATEDIEDSGTWEIIP